VSGPHRIPSLGDQPTAAVRNLKGFVESPAAAAPPRERQIASAAVS
jgi:hypothetical protein